MSPITLLTRKYNGIDTLLAPLTRRSTKGPLDVDDPLAVNASVELAPGSVTAEAANTPIPTALVSPEHPVADPNTDIVAAPLVPPQKDFSYLLRPEIYHPLSRLDLPASSDTPNFQPHPTTSIAEFLSRHDFRSAATAAVLRLCARPSPQPAEIFSLVFTRLACLTLINHLPFAAEESKALQDVNSPFYRDRSTGKHLLPWNLRVLAVRLQSIGYVDVKRGVSGYYDLAREARAQVRQEVDAEGKNLWKEKLQEIGICVANALIESGDMVTAAKYLESLRPTKSGRRDDLLDGRLTMLYINIGDLDAARRCLTHGNQETSPNAKLQPLFSMAEGRFSNAVAEWERLPSSDMVTQNVAVCLFYIGKVDESLRLLQGLIGKGRSLYALTLNLATLCELCSERRQRKGELSGGVAGIDKEKEGGERSAAGIKM